MKISFPKKAGYRLYGILYTIFRLLPVNKHQVYFVMTHDSSDEGNCGMMKQYFDAHPAEGIPWQCKCLTRPDTRTSGFILRSAYTLARSRFVFTDNAFLPLAYLRLRPETELVQLWHGTGTIKKFGQHVNSGELGALEARCGRNISYVIVSSEATRQLYSECFGVDVERVRILGLPRSDAFFGPDFTSFGKKTLESSFPEFKGKRLVLYAPTFRDDSIDEQAQLKTIQALTDRLSDCLPSDAVLGLRLHPSLSSSLSIPSGLQDAETHAERRVIDLSGYPLLNTLLASTDLLITDYSSIIFEYSLLKRPMLFYAYDLDHFENDDRGFYRDYRSYVPGRVCTDRDELADAILNVLAGSDAVSVPSAESDHTDFIRDSFAYTDGHAAERIYRMLTGTD